MTEAARGLRAQLDGSLFPRRTGERLLATRLDAAVVVVALAAIAVVLQLLRIGWSPSLESVWAEDGTVFLQGALTRGLHEVAFAPYAEYLVLVPRLLAAAASLAPLRFVPAALSILSAAIVAASGLAVWVASGGHIRSPYLRGTLAALTVLCPVAGLEATDSAAYVSWYMLFATFWLLFWRPETNWGAGLAGLFIGATALSNPGVWLLAPVAVLRALAVRDRRDAIIVGSFFASAAVQLPVIATHNEPGSPIWTAEIWTAYLQRVLDSGVFGEQLGGDLWSALGWPLLIVVTAVVVGGLALGARRASRGARWFALIAMATSLGMFVFSAYQRDVGMALRWTSGAWGGAASRYAIVPVLLFLSAALVVVDQQLRRARGGRAELVTAAATLAVAAVAIASSFELSEPDVRGTPPWHESLRQAAAACEAGTGTGAVATSPPGFGVQLTCEDVAPFAPARR